MLWPVGGACEKPALELEQGRDEAGAGLPTHPAGGWARQGNVP